MISHIGECSGVDGVQLSSGLVITFRKIHSRAVLVSCVSSVK